jgi:tetratricopeptide (TPR) repeat protein
MKATRRLSSYAVDPAGWRLLDRLCDEFESRWQANEQPRIEDFLARIDQQRQADLLSELLALELDFRCERGELPSEAEYVARFAVHSSAVRAAFGSRAGPLPENAADTEGGAADNTPQPLARSSDGNDKARAPAASVPIDPSPAAAQGQPSESFPAIPGYEIQSLLGRGGMGIVYKARHIGLGRTVAIKMLLAGPHAGGPELARFRAEAEAVARLQHPHVVQVFEVGDHGGQPYFSLEYVDGGHLGQQIGGTPQPPRDAAQLVETLARAVHEAHQRGVVHRDLKPANILLRADGTPKISDFGLAKRLEGESQTVTGAVMGTPSYMAPEQARGDKEIGPAADIYALGAILYEALTGRAPFRGETPWDTVAQVIADEPVPPTRLQPKLPRDLETICVKCLQKEPSRRYASAEELADELRRCLEGKPIVARPVRWWEKTWKWARRHPAVAASLAACLLAIAGGLAATTAMWRVAESRRKTADDAASQAVAAEQLAETRRKAAVAAERQARAAEHLAETRRKLADDTSLQARTAIREYFVLATEHPEFQRDGMRGAREILLDNALQYFRRLTELRGDDPALRLDVADAHYRVGIILASRGSLPEALREFQSAKRISDELLKVRPDHPPLLDNLAKTLGQIADLESKRGRLDEAFDWQRQAIEVAARLAKAFPDDEKYQRSLASRRIEQAQLHYARADYSAALRDFDIAREVYERVQKSSPSDAVLKSIAFCLVAIGQSHWAAGQPADAERVYGRAISIREEIAPRHRYPEDRSALVRTYALLAHAQAKLGRRADALRSHQKAVVIREELVRTNPDVTRFRDDLARSYVAIADEIPEKDGVDEIFKLREKAVEQFQHIVSASPANVEYARALAVAHAKLAYSYRRHKNQPDKALEHLTKGTTILEGLVERKVATDHHRFSLAQLYAETALLDLQRQRYENALAAYSKSNPIVEALRAATPKSADYRYQLSTNYANMAYCQQRLGRFEDALRMAIKILALREELVKTNPQVAQYAADLAKTRKDLAGAALLFIEQAVPPGKDTTPAAKREVLMKRREVWKKWVAEFPDVSLFQQNLADCDRQIADLKGETL